VEWAGQAKAKTPRRGVVREVERRRALTLPIQTPVAEERLPGTLTFSLSLAALAAVEDAVQVHL